MNRWLTVFRWALVFAAGMLAGVVLSQAYVRQRIARFVPRHPAIERPLFGAYIARELHLTPDQQAAIEPILEARFRELEALRAQHLPAMRAVFQQLAAEINPHLTPDQRDALDRLMERARRRGGHPPARPGMPGRRVRDPQETGPARIPPAPPP